MEDQLCFFSQSADKAPGQGCRETVVDAARYRELSDTRNWRRVLSNFHHSQAPIPWFDRTFRSVEHAYQYTKLRIAHGVEAEALTLESGSRLATGEAGAHIKQAGRSVHLTADKLRLWDQIRLEVMEQLVAAKAEACWLFRTVLLGTHPAQLWHLRPRQSRQRWQWMECLRESLLAGESLVVFAQQRHSYGNSSKSDRRPVQGGHKRKSSAPVRGTNAQRRPRVRVGELRQQICALQAKLDHANGVQTPHTNQLEYNEETSTIIGHYRRFITGACRRLGIPRSFLLQGIEDGSLIDWKQARSEHEAAIHRAVAEGNPVSFPP